MQPIRPGLTAIMVLVVVVNQHWLIFYPTNKNLAPYLEQLSVNGQDYEDGRSNRVLKSIGFVDQDDFFTYLTVYETILNSALLRLPKQDLWNQSKICWKSIERFWQFIHNKKTI